MKNKLKVPLYKWTFSIYSLIYKMLNQLIRENKKCINIIVVKKCFDLWGPLKVQILKAYEVFEIVIIFTSLLHYPLFAYYPKL